MISIIIPAYNAGKYIGRCLNSIKAQVYSDYEVIIINDGSIDNTKEIINKHCDLDDKFTIIDQNNRGVSAARNMGLKNACGDFIVFIDSDDYIEPNFLESMVYSIKNHDVGMVCCGYFCDDNSGICDSIRLYNKERYINQLDCMNFVVKTENYGGFLWNKIFKKSVIDEYNIRFNPNTKICEDMLFTLKYVTHIKNTFYIPDLLYHYVKSKDGATKQIKIESLKTLILANEKIKSIAEEYPATEFYNNVMKKYANDLLMVLMEESLAYKKDYIKRNDNLLKALFKYMTKKSQRKYKLYSVVTFPFWLFGMRMYRKIK